jgi:hypothetical protein
MSDAPQICKADAAVQRLVKDPAAQQIPDIAKCDPTLTERVMGLLRPIAKRRRDGAHFTERRLFVKIHPERKG